MKANTVAQLRLLDRRAAQLVVEDARAAPKDRFLVILGSEGKAKPRRDIVAIAGDRLPVVAHTKSECELRLDPDLILGVSIYLVHVERRVWIAAIDAKEQRRAGGKPGEVGELVCPGKIRRVEGGDVIGPQPAAKQQGVAAAQMPDGVLEIERSSGGPIERRRWPGRKRIVDIDRRDGRGAAGVVFLINERKHQVILPAGRPEQTMIERQRVLVPFCGDAAFGQVEAASLLIRIVVAAEAVGPGDRLQLVRPRLDPAKKAVV